MDNQFDSLSTYISLAKKTISKFAPKFYNGLAKEMLSNEEAVSDVATAIMYADWRFDPTRPGKNGQKKTLYSYRNQCAIWAIKTYITQKYKKKCKSELSLDRNINDSSDGNNSYDFICSSDTQDPLDLLIEAENKQIICDSIDQILSSPMITDKQRQQIHMYFFEDHTLSSIGKLFGVSREAVRQNIKRAIDSIKIYDTSNS